MLIGFEQSTAQNIRKYGLLLIRIFPNKNRILGKHESAKTRIPAYFTQWSPKRKPPAGIYLLKLTMETLEGDVKYVQS